MDLNEAYLVMQKASGIEVGDKVEVLRAAENREMGWNNEWVHEMDYFIDETATVRSVADRGIRISNPEYGEFGFPFFVLAIVEKKPKEPKKLTLDDVPEEIKISCRDKYIKILDKGMFEKEDWTVCEMCDFMDSKYPDKHSCNYCPLCPEWCQTDSDRSRLSGFMKRYDLPRKLTFDWSRDISVFINMLNQSIVNCRKYD